MLSSTDSLELTAGSKPDKQQHLLVTDHRMETSADSLEIGDAAREAERDSLGSAAAPEPEAVAEEDQKVPEIGKKN